MANAIGKVFDNITEFIEVKTEQLKLRLITKLAKVFSGAISLSFLITLGLLFVFFVSLGAAFWVNEVMDSNYAGFFIIAGCYLLLIILTFILLKTKTIQRWFEVLILKVAEYEHEQDEQDN